MENRYQSFVYTGDVKEMIFETKELCYTIRVPFHTNGYAFGKDQHLKTRIVDAALHKLAEMFSTICDIDIRELQEYDATEVRFSVKVLTETEKKTYEAQISNLQAQLKTHKKINAEANEALTKYFKVSRELESERELTRNLNSTTFLQRLKYLFTGVAGNLRKL